nr:unnamed protein product [Spirometra erinaceieuropaei]
MALVTGKGAISEAFAVTNRMKEDCELAPTLFYLMFSAMMMKAYREERPGIRTDYTTYGRLHDSRRLQTPAPLSTTPIHDLLFADDCPVNSTTE